MERRHVAEPKMRERNDEESVASPELANVTAVLTMDVSPICLETSLHETRVRELAFSLYEQRGCRDGHHVEDWLEAEAILLSQPKQAT